LDAATLAELFSWTDTEFNQRLEGSPIRRIGHERWLRNIAVAIGNALRGPLLDTTRTLLMAALHERADHASELVREHVAWALAQ
ncbi:tRNA epoxyqueuosine(34) reductase QueG, partial [Escherichia coli]|nr:tRNA epoxyqueuosine(34) reductase QueG [Escherichia coli]